MEKAIISCITDNMLENLEKDFLTTLRNKAKFNGSIFLIYYGKNNGKIEDLTKEYNVKFFQIEKKVHPVNQRYSDFLSILDQIPKNINQILFIDSGDVWFQDSIEEIFDLTKNSCGFVEENIMADEGFAKHILDKIAMPYREEFFIYANNQKLINGGMIAGDREILKRLIGKVDAIIKILNQDYYGLDQAVLNYVVRKWRYGQVIPERFNFVLVTQKNPFDIKNGLILDKKGKPVCVIHNAGEKKRFFVNGMKFQKPPKIESGLNGELWGITVFFNFFQDNKIKIDNYKKFRESSKKQGLNLLTVELAFKNNSFFLSEADSEILIQIKTDSILWQKERLLNLALSKLPKNCDKIVWVDCDIIFSNENWVSETSDLLKLYCIVQPFQYCIRLPKGIDYIIPEKTFFSKEILDGYKTFGSGYRISETSLDILEKDSLDYGHAGFAFAARLEIFKETGFLDRIILPAVDLFMLRAFYGFGHDYFNEELNRQMPNWSCEKYFLEWSDKIFSKVKGSVYYVNGYAMHLWHGNLQKRESAAMVEILRMHNFDPQKDIKIGKSGCWEWATNKKIMHDLMEKNFVLRDTEEQDRTKIEFFHRVVIKFIFKIDRGIGLIGILFKKKFPKMYGLILKSKSYSLLIKARDYFLHF